MLLCGIVLTKEDTMKKVFAGIRSVTRNTDPKSVLFFVRKFFNSYCFYAFETIAACLFAATGKEVAGAVCFVCLICVILLVCDDILPTLPPFLLLSAFVTNCYDSFDIFFPYIKYAPAAALCLIFHFTAYRRPVRTGISAYGILAVGVAIVLGGIGRFTLKDYVYGAYYVLGLGFGMLATYYLMKSQLSADRNYDLRARFSVIMILLGLLCTFIVAFGYYKNYRNIITGLYSLGFSRNNISTLLMFAMPFPLFLAKKCPWIAILTPVFYAAIAVTTSRGGLLGGSAELILCCVYWIFSGKKRLLRILLCVVSVLLVFILFGRVIINVIENRILADDVITKDARYKMLLQSIEKFKKNPLVGFGILDEDIYYASFKKKGSMSWYHMMIPQIVGSMGLVGIAAYGFQFVGRCRLIFKNPCAWSLCLGISYFGILAMSQVNPGEFCPLPFELLTVFLFILQEKRSEKRSFPLKEGRDSASNFRKIRRIQ